MPLLKSNKPNYIKRTRLFVSSTGPTTVARDGIYDITFTLTKQLENVIGVELVGYNIPDSFVPTFTGVDRGSSGNNKIDVYHSRSSTLSYTITLPELKYNPGQEVQMLDDMELIFQERMDSFGDAYFNSANNVTWRIQEDALLDNRTDMSVRDSATPSFGVTTNILYETGDNSAQFSPALVFGHHPEDADYFTRTIFPLIIPPKRLAHINLSPYRYVDVYVHEFSELGAIGRIDLVKGDQAPVYTSTDMRKQKTRLLVNPLRRMNRMNISLRLQTDRRPWSKSNTGYDLVFEVLTLSEETNVPDWIDQELGYS